MRFVRLFMGPFRPTKRPAYPTSEELMAEQIRQAKLRGENKIKADRVVSQRHEDRWRTGRIVDWDSLPTG